MKRLLWFSLLVVLMTCAQRAKAQPPPAGSIKIGSTQVQGGINGDCLNVTNGRVSQQVCGGGGGASPAGPANCIQLTNGVSSLTNGCASQPGSLLGNPAIVIGSELVTNGGFSGGTTGWTLGTDIAYGTNNVICTMSVMLSGCNINQSTIATVAGDYYRVQFTVSASNAPTNFTLDNEPLFTSGEWRNGTWTVVFRALMTGNDNIVFDDFFYGAGDTWTLTNISIKQVSPVDSPLTLIGPNGVNELHMDDVDQSLGFGQNNLANSTVGRNTAIGNRIMTVATSGDANTAVGYEALYQCTTCADNSVVGALAGFSLVSGNDNNFVGRSAGNSLKTGSYNTINGDNALFNNISGDGNSCLGFNCLYNALGSHNVSLGFKAGRYETGSDSFYVDNQDRTDTAGDKAGALLYGTFSATPASQTLTINAAVSTLANLTISTGSPIGSANAAVCWKTTTTLSYCTTVVGAGGTCTCH